MITYIIRKYRHSCGCGGVYVLGIADASGLASMSPTLCAPCTTILRRGRLQPVLCVSFGPDVCSMRARGISTKMSISLTAR